MIEIKNLCKKYAAATPIKDLSVTINDGDVISVIGPSGTGKSTLIRCMNRLETPTSGEIFVDGECVTDKKCNLSQLRKKMGMVFQSFNLFGHLSVIENVMRPQTDLLGADKQTAYDKSMELLKMVGLEDRAFQYPDMLSGGQKQRVAIARTLSTDPDIILLDEPTSALDPTMVGEVQSVIKNLAKTGKTMLIVTHEMKFAQEISNRVFFMTDGGIYEDGTPDVIFNHPQRELTRRFIRQLKVFEWDINGKTFDFPGFISGITAYCTRNGIAHGLTGKVIAATEELAAQILLEELPEPCISIIAEYDESRKTVYAKFRYPGDYFNPLTSENTVSLALINHYCAETEYFRIENQSYTNEIVLHIR